MADDKEGPKESGDSKEAGDSSASPLSDAAAGQRAGTDPEVRFAHKTRVSADGQSEQSIGVSLPVQRPITDPDILERLDALDPGRAKIILAQVAEEAKRDFDARERYREHDRFLEKFSIIATFTLTAIALIGVLWVRSPLFAWSVLTPLCGAFAGSAFINQVLLRRRKKRPEDTRHT